MSRILFTGGDACSGSCLLRRGLVLGVGCLLLEGVWSGGACSWGVSRPTPKGEVEGIRSRPISKGAIDGDQVQAHRQGGNSGASGPGPLSKATAAGGMHPTGMHSFLQNEMISPNLMN